MPNRIDDGALTWCTPTMPHDARIYDELAAALYRRSAFVNWAASGLVPEYAPGAEYGGKKCGMIGELGCFSFFSNKNLVTGEGGLVFTRNPALAEKVRAMRSHGMRALSWDKFRGRLSSYDIETLGYNYRTTEIQSALGLIQLKKLERNNRKRGRLVETYRKALQDVPGIVIPFRHFKGDYSSHLFPILLKGESPRNSQARRDQLIKELAEQGIQASVHYPPIHLFSLYRKSFGYRSGMLPKTEEVSRCVITLPLHPRMSAADAKWISKKVEEIVKRWS